MPMMRLEARSRIANRTEGGQRTFTVVDASQEEESNVGREAGHDTAAVEDHTFQCLAGTTSWMLQGDSHYLTVTRITAAADEFLHAELRLVHAVVHRRQTLLWPMLSSGRPQSGVCPPRSRS
jgi:hydroxypyruvate isomerase